MNFERPLSSLSSLSSFTAAPLNSSFCQRRTPLERSFPALPRQFQTSVSQFEKGKIEKGKEQKASGGSIVFVKKVAEHARDGTYVIAFCLFAGFAVLGIGKSLWTGMLSPNSSQRLYQKAAKKIKQDQDVMQLLGEPLKSFGEGSRRRSHIAAETFYDAEGRENKQIRFYVSGPHGRGVCYCQFVKNGRWFEFVTLFVDAGGKRVILIQDGQEFIPMT
eukprot:CAMPEP_0201488082 /NCGR_PEP_ID=MMETSP0151_2-20130828/16764_1 /ASSEMBLY_ACC=CAM_ASM_000257 /TAXON_ID=200890 /ORGANISM="Paramoeba atlantica, Strain 621/1 / CCAP 1560/9" /LENGTH=217 /DNA_ID=CAMNT_0047873301 /DNA_START=165 /DNA_END=818 /DNA_ORIENTATION=+